VTVAGVLWRLFGDDLQALDVLEVLGVVGYQRQVILHRAGGYPGVVGFHARAAALSGGADCAVAPATSGLYGNTVKRPIYAASAARRRGHHSFLSAP